MRYLLGIIGLFILKITTIKLSVNELCILIKPIVIIIEFFFNINFVYVKDLGYYNEILNINIGKSCLGINFTLIMLTMLVTIFVNQVKGGYGKIVFIISTMIFSYGINIVATSSRIIGTIYLMKLLSIEFFDYERLLHQIIGTASYLSFMILSYYIFYRGFRKLGGEYENKI